MRIAVTPIIRLKISISGRLKCLAILRAARWFAAAAI